MAKILITGGTGLVGTTLIRLLQKNNHQVVVLSRNPKKPNEFKWNLSTNYIDEKALQNVHYIIHLAGAGIADKKWSKTRKQEIINSRVKTTELLYAKVKELKIPLKKFISASATGYYGAITTDKIFNEEDRHGNDFLSEVCVKWEKSANLFKNDGFKVCILRTGIVLSKQGGALEKMKTPIISALGSGNQYLPWIHLDDLCEMYLKILDDDFTSVYNAVAPEHHTSNTFSKLLAKKINRIFLPINLPSFILKMVFGKMAIILLKGSRISSKKIEKSGYSFRYRTLAKAFENLL